MNSLVSESILLNLSSDPETQGFDLQAGQSWIYPTNYPIRDYQFNIVQKALLENTLVSLPTGLGKTFIAAVVMYNFFRWYPKGKIIFMAPTRPLVKQQVDACYDIMAIPKEVTAELTGTKLANIREAIWKEKRVFFITPHILENDLETFHNLGPKIKCIVFDEAHKARGNYAYCEVIRKLSSTNKYFRVLALSATPGGTINDILEVVQNLLISHLEVRTEESLDVNPYVFHRNLTTIVVPLGEKLESVKDEYMKVLEYYTQTLMKFKVLQGNCGNLTKGKIFMTLKNYRQNARSTSPHYGEIMKSLNVCITLFHAYELLVRHGLRSFLTFYEEHINKPLLKCNTRILEIMNNVRAFLGPALKLEQLPDGEYPEVSKDIKFGHPKFYKLRDILVEHFKQKESSSRVIVFFEFRDSVTEAYALLIQSKPVLKPKIFLGQGHGVTQRQQINVVKAFREGLCNILLSTSIGEEGLDVGDVDLIVCFDISNKSPIRMVQRMGRTGRKKEGSVVVLVTEGKEQQTLKDCLIHKNNVAVHVLGSRELAKGLKENSPRLVPEGLKPKCEKIFITVNKPLKKKSTLKDIFHSVSSSSSEPNFSPYMEIVRIEERIPTNSLLITKESCIDADFQVSTIFNKRIEKQRSFQEIHNVKHSKDTEILVKLLQTADSRRFNIPMSQLGSTQESHNKNLKQIDIRNMFVKSQSLNDFVIPGTQVPKTTISTCIPETNNFGSRELFNELSNFLSIEMSDLNKPCDLCLGKRDCEKNTLIRKPAATLDWLELDETVFSSLTTEDLKLFAKSLDRLETKLDFEDNLDFDTITTPKESQELMVLEDIIDNSILDGVYNKSCNFEAPKTMNTIVRQYSTSIIEMSQIQSQSTIIQKETVEPNNTLDFFLLSNLEDIFVDENNSSSQGTIIYSPDMFEPSPTLPYTKVLSTPQKTEITLSSDEGSPILGSFQVKRKKMDHKQLVTRNLMENCSRVIESPTEFTMNRTKLSSTPHEKVRENVCVSPNKTAMKSPEAKLGIEDICDVSFFGLPEIAESDEDMFSSPKKTSLKKSNAAEPNLSKIVELGDFIDVSSLENCQDISKKLPLSSQVTITQMISLVNEESPEFKSSTNVRAPSLLSKTNERRAVDSDFENTLEPYPFVNKNKRNKSNSAPSNSIRENPFLIKKSENLYSEQVSEEPLHIVDSELFDFSFNNKRTAGKRINKVSPTKTNSHRDEECPISIENADESIKKLSLNLSIHSNPSDDEFEATPWIKPKAKVFKKPCLGEKPEGQSKNSKKTKTVKMTVKQFIEDEAELSLCNKSDYSDDEEDGENQDCYDASFVADESHYNDTQMHIRYLQSVRSPVLPNRFKRAPIFRKDIYSQEVNREDDTYLEDSFVVLEGQEDTIASQAELTELEIMERKLELKRKKRKKSDSVNKPLKRRRIIIDESDSD